jgi:hypothetical protein
MRLETIQNLQKKRQGKKKLYQIWKIQEQKA